MSIILVKWEQIKHTLISFLRKSKLTQSRQSVKLLAPYREEQRLDHGYDDPKTEFQYRVRHVQPDLSLQDDEEQDAW